MKPIMILTNYKITIDYRLQIEVDEDNTIA